MPAAPLLMTVRRPRGKWQSRAAQQGKCGSRRTSRPARAPDVRRASRRVADRRVHRTRNASRRAGGVAVHDADAQARRPRRRDASAGGEPFGARRSASPRREASSMNLVRPAHHVVGDACRIGAAAAGADIARARDFGLDIAAHRAMARDAALDLGEPVRLGVEPVEVAVENDRHRRALVCGQPLDRIERGKIAVESADDVEHVGGEFRRAVEHRGR